MFLFIAEANVEGVDVMVTTAVGENKADMSLRMVSCHSGC